MSTSEESKEISPATISRANVMKLSVTKRILWFMNLHLRHPHLHRMVSRVLPLAFVRGGASVVLVVGATGVGKTVSASLLCAQITTLLEQEGLLQQGDIPAIQVSAVSANPGEGFDWNLLLHRILVALQEPLLSMKRARVSKSGGATFFSSLEAATLSSALWEVCSKALRRRSTRVVIIDEAYAMFHGLDETQSHQALDKLKSVTNDTNAVFVLLSSYDLLVHIQSSAQLARRIHVIPFSRYGSSKEDKTEFRRAMRRLIVELPIEEPIDVEPTCDFLEPISFGCIGQGKDHLNKTLAVSLMSQGRRWSTDALREAFSSVAQAQRIAQDIEEGEALLRQCGVGIDDPERIDAYPQVSLDEIKKKRSRRV